MILHIGDYLVDILYMPWRSKVHTLITIFLGTTIPSSVQFGLINLQIFVSNTNSFENDWCDYRGGLLQNDSM